MWLWQVLAGGLIVNSAAGCRSCAVAEDRLITLMNRELRMGMDGALVLLPGGNRM